MSWDEVKAWRHIYGVMWLHGKWLYVVTCQLVFKEGEGSTV